MDYKIFTTKYDQIIRPLDMLDKEVLADLAKEFHLHCPIEDFEPLRETLEKITAPKEPTTVTLLIDNSGSMRGRAIRFAIGTAGIISMVLDRKGIPNEVLGFTTVSWRGGQPRENWLNLHKGPKPKSYIPSKEFPNPGRLNALRHVIYKEVTEQMTDVRDNMALMLQDGFLKENIDGEAVLWAAERLRKREGRKILLVISDGAPVDESTDGANELDGTFATILIDHLKHVIQQIKADGDIEIDAVGMTHDVEKYYGVGEYVDKLEDVAPVAIQKIRSLLNPEV